MDRSRLHRDARPESPETITRRIQGHIVRTALDEEIRAQKALKLLKIRDRRIAMLEMKIADLQKDAHGPTIAADVISQFRARDLSSGSSGDETRYLSLPSSEASKSPRYEDETVANDEDISGAFIGPEESKRKIVENVSVPRLKLSTTSVTNSEGKTARPKNVDGADFNDSSSLASEEFRHDESSVDLVVTAALAFSKFDDELRKSDGWQLDGDGGKKLGKRGSRATEVATKTSTSLPWMKTRRGSSGKRLKRGIRWRNEKTRGSNVLSRNLREVQAGLDALLQKTRKVAQSDSPVQELLAVQKQKVEDKVVQEDAQEADASTPAPKPFCKRNDASTQTCVDFNDQYYDPAIIENTQNYTTSSQNHSLGHKGFSTIWSDEPAPQWLIEEALNRGPKFSKDNVIAKADDNRDNHEDNCSSKLSPESIILDLEKKLCSTRVELADALNEQLLIKNKYKKALKSVKNAADEERNEMQRMIVKICTSILEKFGPDALTDNRIKRCHKKHQKPLQHFGKLSRKLQKKLRIATLTSVKLKQEVQTTKRDLEEKAGQFDSLAKSFEVLKLELKNAEINVNDLRNKNLSLRKEIDDAREWMQTRFSKERNEKINAAQFREIQRSRELSNLKKKSEEDLSTMAQLRNKLLRLESANSNKGFLLSNYKSQLADLTAEKNNLSTKIKELESENCQLRNNNAQLKASVTLINSEKEKMHRDSEKSEKSEADTLERMQSKLATKYERSMLQKIDTMRAKYDEIVESMRDKLRDSENLAAQYFEAIKRFLKDIHEHHRMLDTERDLSRSEASEREAHETACSILNITPFELTGFLKGHPLKTINPWLSEVQKLTSRKTFAEDLGKFLFARAIGSAED